jgi:hypothetical protein
MSPRLRFVPDAPPIAIHFPAGDSQLLDPPTAALGMALLQTVGVKAVADVLGRAFEAAISTPEGEAAFCAYLERRHSEGWK